ncbi:MAG: hypothetical protein V7K64_31530 [Nostoc sp.]|nr:hypothetical protein [Nostoc sp. JL34]MBN3884774.1 hypothetical protein [Nostoc sp. JL34]
MIKGCIYFYTNKELYVHRPGGGVAGYVVYRRRHRSFFYTVVGAIAVH